MPPGRPGRARSRPCTSPQAYTNLADGEHTFPVRAKDAAGNVDATPASRTFTVAVVAPAPDTTITGGPSGPITATTQTFTFTSEPGATFECRLDTPAGAGTYAACTSPQQYTATALGDYTFFVRAKNAAGTVDATPATRTFRIEAIVTPTPTPTVTPTPTAVEEEATVSGTVPSVLGLVLDGTAAFPPFIPGVATEYQASISARITTSAATAELTVVDQGAQPGRLVNGTYAMVNALEARATNATQPTAAFAPISATPLRLLTVPDLRRERPRHDRVPAAHRRHRAAVGRRLREDLDVHPLHDPAMIHALKPIRTGRRSLLAAVAACLACAAPASADAGKVLVFTGTAGPANAASAPAAAAVQALGAANGFTVDVTSEATAISTASLSQYRAVAFVHSAGNVLDGGQQAALQDYVVAGGGFVGVGETAKLEEGEAFFDTLIGLTGEIRTTASSTSPQDVEFLDRVHPATRSNPLVWKGHTDTYYKWTANPTGQVHTVARVRFGALPDGTSVTNDAVTRFTGSDNRIQPQNERAVSWCRDVGAGRSFYTALGGTAAAYGEPAVTRQLLGAIQWAAGMSAATARPRSTPTTPRPASRRPTRTG